MDMHTIFSDKNYFEVNVNEYVCGKDFVVTRPASLNYPKNNSVMFIMHSYVEKMKEVFETVNNCLIFWPEEDEIPESICKKHAVVKSANTHLEFCRFFNSHNITNFCQNENVVSRDNYVFVGNVSIEEGTQVFPYVYINGDVHIGKNCYIGAGAKIIGNVYIGDNVLIKENAVIGADGLTTDREADGTAASMPQFGGVVIEDNVQIGANTTIARGAIDNTIISKGCKIDNNCFISHNNFLEENVFVVGETISFGSVTIKKNSQISGNATLRNGIVIGENCVVGMGAVVTKNVEDGCVVKGNPAR